MKNPLKTLCERMGLSTNSFSEMGMKDSRIEEALSDNPKEPLATYLKIAASLEITSRVQVDRPLAIWFDISAIDELHYTEPFRERMGLCALPKSRGELRQMIRNHRRNGKSYGDICEYMERNYIPTAGGLKGWRRSTIAQHLKNKKGIFDEEMKIGMTDAFRLDFRSFVLENLFVEMTPFDPFAQVRYEIRSEEINGRLYVTSKTSMPVALRRWTATAISSLLWFRPTDWGVGEYDGNVRYESAGIGGCPDNGRQAEEAEGDGEGDNASPLPVVENLPG